MSIRTNTNFLIMRPLLENIPVSGTKIYSIAGMVFNPRVRIVENDCGSKVGKSVPASLELVGEISANTGQIITEEYIESLLEEGIYKTEIKTLFSCTSEGGVCQKCYQATQKTVAPTIGSLVVIQPSSRLAYWGYLTRSFSGSIIGAKPLQTPPLPIRESLVKSVLTPGILAFLHDEAFKLEGLPANYETYCRSIVDPLERALLTLALYSLYSNVSN